MPFAKDLQEAINGLIRTGYYFDEFLGVIDANPPTLREVGTPFLSAVARLGIEVSDRRRAGWLFIRNHLKGICNSEGSPRDALAKLFPGFWYQSTAQDNQSPNDFGLVALQDLYAYGDEDMLVYCQIKGVKTMDDVEVLIRKEAQLWETKFGSLLDRGVIPPPIL